ncbi:MAG: F-type H+-transporting ATPase subunit b [Thermoanaerobaculia bacterium]|jgi:F-type H+-transporting ATPase subunit b|nr:F-type H+-transporting ATPase subunit b [Thermoanaerobaculia bacterium]
MMRRALLVFFLLLIPGYLLAQTKGPEPNNVAQGAEKVSHEQTHPTEEHGGEHEAPKTYFGIPGWLLKLVNMLLFFGVLAYLIGGPIKNALANRRVQIQADAEEARARRTKADQLAGDIQARLTQIEADVRGIQERAQSEGERQKRELIAAAEAEAQKILQSARNEVENRLKHARHELTEYAGELATQRAEQILREKVTDQDRSRLFEESVREVEGARS